MTRSAVAVQDRRIPERRYDQPITTDDVNSLRNLPQTTHTEVAERKTGRGAQFWIIRPIRTEYSDPSTVGTQTSNVVTIICMTPDRGASSLPRWWRWECYWSISGCSRVMRVLQCRIYSVSY